MPEGEPTIPTLEEAQAALAQLQAFVQGAPTGDLAAQIATLQSIVTAGMQRTAAEAAAERAAFLKPLTDILSSPEFSMVKAAVAAIDNRYDQEAFASHLRCLKTGLAMLVAS